MSLSLDKNCVGYKIKIKNILDEVIEGEIFAFEPSLEILALCFFSNLFLDCSGYKHESSTRRDFKIIKIDTIKEIINLDTSKKEIHVPFANTKQPLPGIKIEKLEEVNCEISS